MNGLRLSPKQQVIYRELLNIDQKAAKAYLGAWEVLENKKNPDRFAQSAHSLREVTSIISRNISIPEEAKENRSTLVRKLEKQFVDDLDLLPDPAEKETRVLIKKWSELHRDFFVAIAHHGKEVSEYEFNSKLLEFEETLLKFLKPIPETLEDLDFLLSIQTPTEDDVNKLLELLKHPTHVEYFFSKLDSLGWLTPLKEKGFFSKSPKPLREDNYIMYPIWPLSRYFIKVSAQKPTDVMGIIKSMPKTDNFRVHLDLIECCLQMPSSVAKEIVPLIREWVKTPYITLIPEKSGDLVIKLSNEGENKAALQLLDGILDVTIENGKDEKEKSIRLARDAQPYFDTWGYEQILKKTIPTLGPKDPCAIMKILCEKLSKAIELELSLRKTDTKYHDFSHIWRRAIEDHHQNRDRRDVKNILIIALRNHLGTVGRNDKGAFLECYSLLSNYNYAIFRRIELHLMRLFSNYLKNEIQKILSKKDVFEDVHLWYEYYHLLEEQFSRLSLNLQATTLKWIEEGPNIEKYKAYLVKKGITSTQDQIEAFRARWQLKYLSAIEYHLPLEWKKKFKELAKKYGKPDHPDFHIYRSEIWVGPTSPLTKEEIEKMSSQKLVGHLKKWIPPQEILAPSREGLGRILKKVVSEFPDQYVDISQEFAELHPAYTYHLIEGLREAVKKEKSFDWELVISLCQEIVTTSNLPPIPEDEDRIVDWKCVKKAIANLLEEGFKSKKVSCPFELREILWELLTILIEDEEPTLEYEKEYAGTNMDSLPLSLNTVRGRAMHALIQYALWCVRNLNLEKGEKGMVSEIKEILESKLNPQVEPTETIRAVYGLYFPTLFYLDDDWTKEHVSIIFPEDSKHRNLWRATWDAYITSANFYDKVYQTLHSQYTSAIRKLSSPKISQIAKERLSEHLMKAYLRGLESLGEDSLIELFFKEAPEKIKKHAIWFVGTEMKYLSNKKIEQRKKEEIISCIMNLWDWRLKEAEEVFKKGKEKKMLFVEELEGFGWWFINSVFNDVWAISQLLRTLKFTNGKIDQPNKIIERLELYIKRHPLQVVEVLILLVKYDKNGWVTLISKEKIKLLIKLIIETSPERETKEKVNDLIGYLIKVGYYEFKEMLLKQN